jgi:F-type H+-transporting ATPase subunit delta
VNKSTIGRRYASALFQLLDESGIEAARNTLGVISQGLEEIPALRHVLASPVFRFEEKQGVLDELSQRTQAPAVVKDFFTQLLKKNRALLLPEIAEAFGDLVDRHKGILKVFVTTAKELGVKEKEAMTTQLGQALKQEVGVTFEVNPQLIAGVQIKIGSRTFDNTVLGRLTSLQAQLTKG